ncbi:MAG TPA: hypothetical protein VI685_14880 [Candidatus Angelobacter sp.]
MRGTLAGEEITEKYIRAKVFPTPPYKSESNIARRTIDLVRGLLNEYYAEDGKEDAVIIGLPTPPPGKRIKFRAGEAYRPVFSYNPRHPDSQKFRLGLHFLNEKSPESINQALGYLHELALSETGHPAAEIALVETLCAMSVYMSRSSPTRELFSVAFQIVKNVIESNPDDWHPHAARGALLLCCHEIKSATAEFHTALRLDKTRTQHYAWYHAFLFTVGQRNQALQLARSHAAESIESPYAQTALGIYLYALREFKEAEAVFQNSLTLDRNCWLTHLALSALYLSVDRPDEALDHYTHLQVLVGAERSQWIMPGLAALCAVRANEIGKAKRKWTIRWAKELITNIDDSMDWVQCSLACIAFGETRRAVWALQHARHERHPLALWLEVWPIFDPIRRQKAFQSLVNRINLPKPR